MDHPQPTGGPRPEGMGSKNIESFYPLSPMQQGMLFHSLFAPESGVYVEQLNTTLRGPLDLAAFERTWQRVLQRHPILRTAFAWEGLKEPIQVVRREVTLTIAQEDWRGLAPAEQRSRLAAFLAAEQAHGFDLTQAPLIRLALLRLADAAYEFVWTHHHILLDGWSIPLLLKEVFAFYAAFSRGQDLQLPTPRPFRDYIVWLKRQDMAQAEVYWRRALQGFTAPTPLVMAKARNDGANQEARYGEAEIELSAEITAALQTMARQRHLTLNTLVQGAWALLLSRYSGEAEICFGATVSGRPAELSGAESMLGLFINTLPIRVQTPPDASVASWLQGLQAQQAELRQYEFAPLVQIQAWSEVPRGTPLFESILVFENLTMTNVLASGASGALQTQDIRTSSHTNYPLTAVAVPEHELLLRISYDCERFSPEAVRQMLVHWRRLLEGFVSNPSRRLCEVPLLTPEERNRMLMVWNAAAQQFPVEKLAHQLVADQAVRAPRGLAVVSEGTRLDYEGLNTRANQLAHCLKKMGAGPDALIGIYMDRSPEMVVSALGVLKAGSAYLPIDPTYPLDRVAFMLQDSGVKVLLTQAHLAEPLTLAAQYSPVDIIRLDTDWPLIAVEPNTDPHNVARPSNLAYVIYTSGSTGKPKGVMIEHHALLNLIFWHRREFGVSASDRATQLAGQGFDAAVWELWPYLTAGASIHIPDEQTRALPNQLRDWLVSQGITISFVPTPLTEAMLALSWPRDASLRILLTGGDKLHLHPPSDLPFRLINNYGPTEDTVVTTSCPVHPAHSIEAADGDIGAPAIGRPIDNTQVYLLDSSFQPVPVGVPGELCIGGVGLARGYLNRPDLTAEKFVPNPFARDQERGGREEGERGRAGEGGAHLYRTGDLARYLPDGNIEFLGRIDHQVKIRGFRIELGEIEAALLQHPAIREAVVTVYSDEPMDIGFDTQTGASKRLVAYLVPADETEPAIDELKSLLSRTLPSYMAPTAFVFLDKLPLTAHGKVDRRALPLPDFARPDLVSAYVAPQNEIERNLANIWAQVLRVERVGVHDNFFTLGGESILSIQVVARAKQAGMQLTPRLLFQYPTIAELAQVMGSTEEIRAEQGSVTGMTPLTPIQHWFFEHHSSHPHHWNTTMLLEIRHGLNQAMIGKIVEQILRHHDVLRMRFRKQDESGWIQTNAGSDEPAPYSCIDLSSVAPEKQREAIEAQVAALQGSLNLSEGPLLRVAYFDLGRGRPARLLFLFHHLVMDGVSWRILLEDFQTAYQQLDQGKPVQFLPKTTSFQQWSRLLSQHAQSAALQSQSTYWLSMGRWAGRKLPMDHPDGTNTYGDTDHITVSLSAAKTRDLLQRVPLLSGVQINDLLLTALLRTFSRWTGDQKLLVEIEGHGREDIFDGVDLSHTIGWFTTSFPLLLDLENAAGPSEQLAAIRRQLSGVPDHGIGYGLLRYLCQNAGLRDQLAALPLPQVSFNYLGGFDLALPAGSSEKPSPEIETPEPASGGERLGSLMARYWQILGSMIPQRIRLAQESVGPEQYPDGKRGALLYIVAIANAGEFDVRLLYSRKQYNRDTIEWLAQTYLKDVNELIDHCLRRQVAMDALRA